MLVKGKDNNDWGFRNPADGLHIVEMGEGICPLSRDGVDITDKNGNLVYKFPCKVNDPNSESNGLNVPCLITANKFGEQKIADILACVGEYDAIEKMFPGDRSFFEDDILNQVKIKIFGKFLRMQTETTSKNGKDYVNVVKVMSMSIKPDEAKASAPKTAAPATKSEW